MAAIATEAKIPWGCGDDGRDFGYHQSAHLTSCGPSFSGLQTTVPLATWAAEKSGLEQGGNGRLFHAPGIDVETASWPALRGAGRSGYHVVCGVPLANPDFAPFLQRVSEIRPDALLGFVPAGVGPTFMRQFVERGLDKSGIKFIAEGSMTEDDIVYQIGDVALGVITSHHYSAAHDSPENKAFVAGFKKANGGMRPNMMAMQSYDGMHMIYEAMKKNERTDPHRRGACRRNEGPQLDESARSRYRRS